MSRPLRFEIPGAIYHVMNRGSNKIPIFNDPTGDRHLFWDVLGMASDRWQIRIHAYSLMDNHYHLLVETPLPNLSKAMRHIDGVYTQRFNKKHNRDGPLLRGRFKSILVQEDTYFLELVRYIHLNGVRAQKCSSAKNDHHSSHPFYLEPRWAPQWLVQSKVLSYFSPDPDHGRSQLNQFVEERTAGDVEVKLSKKRWPAILGTEAFIHDIKKKFLQNRPPHREKPQEREMAKPKVHDVATVLEKVSEAFHVPIKEIVSHQSTKPNEARKNAMYFLKMKCQLPYTKIGEMMGGVGYTAVGMACKSFVPSDKSEWIERELKDNTTDY